MKRIISALVASFALLAFATPSFATDTMKASTSSSTMSMKTKAMTCPKGQTMVKGYKKKDGTVVKAYCRKSK